MIDLPEPVSPVTAVKPGASVHASSSTSARLRMRREVRVAGTAASMESAAWIAEAHFEGPAQRRKSHACIATPPRSRLQPPAPMPSLTLRPSHKAVAAYYESLAAFASVGATHETAVRSAFATLLETAAKPFGWKLVPEHSMRAKGGRRIQPDGTLMDLFRLQHGHWEAKDSSDDFNKEIRAKIDKGYPTENLLFWEPRRAVLYQHGQRVADVPLDEPTVLLAVLGQFLEFAPEAIAQWESAVTEFGVKVPELGKALAAILKKARKENPKYEAAFSDFVTVCRGSLNPNLSELAVEEMLVQHLLTERILRKIFDIENFRERNVIAADIEKVIATISDRHFRRDDFLRALDPFYLAVETAAETFTDFTEKQKFLNIVHERFFQGFAVKQADVPLDEPAALLAE